LLGDEDEDIAPLDRLRQSRTIAIDQIVAGAAQPRRNFDEAALDALAQSIRERGVLQPVLLRRIDAGEDRFEIVAGERRWRAAQRAQLHEIPALVREFSDAEALEIALIENIQRSDLRPLEEAEGFQRLIDDHGHTQDAIAGAIGKSRSHVANTLRLLALPAGAREHLEAGRLSAGHARALLVTSDADRLADYVVAGGLSVRATERLVQSQAGVPDRPTKRSGPRQRRAGIEKDADIRALEKSVTENLGFAVEITPRSEERGALTIHYQSLEQLDDVLAKLTGIMQPASSSVPPVSADPLAQDFEAVGAFEDSGGAETDDDTAPGSMDFDALLAQTEALLTSGESSDAVDPASDDVDSARPEETQSEAPVPSDPADRPADQLVDSAEDVTVGQDESENPASAAASEDDVLDDDEIAFIDDDDDLATTDT
jgi:ParB family chromosome partitioning protein